MILQIRRGNKVIAESADFSYSPSLQEVRKLTCEVVSVVPIEFKAYNSKSESEYDTVVYNGNTFILYQAPSGDNLNEAGKYKYSLLFYGKEVLLQNVAFLDIVSGTGGEINKIRYTHGGLFQFWGDAKQLAARIEANIQSYNASLGAGYTGIGTWTLNVDAEGELTEDMIDITDGTNLFEALKNFYDKFYLNYYFSTTANGGIITITDKTRPSVNWTFKQGDGGGAVKVSSSVDTSTPVITRIIPQGGSRNVPPEYKKDAKPADESRYCPYILLPNDSDGNIRYYIDSEYGLKNYGVRGKTISNTFSGIYPSIRGRKLGDLYPSGLPEWDTYKADGEPDPQSGKVAGEGASASTRIDKIIGSTPIKSDDSDSFFIYMTSPGFNLGYKVYEDGDSSDKINDNVQSQYKPHAMFDKYRDFECFDIYSTRAYYDQPVKVTATFSGKMLFSILPIGSDAVGKKVKINLRMVTNRVLGQASPLKEVVIGEEGATGMLEIPYDKTALVGYIEKGQNTTVTIRVEFTFDSDVPAGSCKIGFSEEMTCNIHFGNQDGSQDRFYYKYASVTDAVFSMRTGTYTGTEFKINKNGIIPLYGEVNGDTGETEEDVAMFNKGARYKISCYRTDSDNAKLPLYTDGKSPSIAAGTEFVILNIVMPESYVTMAENTLEKAALDYLSRYDHENRTVSLDISSGFVAEHPNLFIDFIEGNMLKVRDDGIGVFDFSDNGQIVDMQLQIQSLEIKYSKENMFPSYSCTIARRKILSFYERLAQENQTASTQNTTNVTLGGSGTGSGTNIFSEQLLNDLIASFQKFNGWFEWDEVNQALRCKSAFYTNQWISALGAQSGSGEPGGGEGGLIKAVYGFADLGKTFDDSNLSNTFNAYTINEIWKLAKEGGGIKNITQTGSGNAVTNMTLSSDGKTITAVFGETFARQQDLGTLNNTVTQLSNKLNNFLEGSDADNIINKWKELEAFLDGLTESDNLAELLALKADKTITISAGTGLTGGGNLSANRTLSLATTGVNAGTYTKVTVDTYGRVTVGDNPTTLAGYGITDAVTLTTNQTISGQKTFTKNILMNSGIGLSYGGNIAFRNTAGNTVISSYGNEGMIYFRPNGDTSDVGVIQINKQGHLNGVSAGFTGGVSAARLTANEYIQIGDAQLVYDSANKALRVKHRTDGNTVGFYSDGWVSALGVKTGGSGGGSGVVNTVYSFANLTDGTTFSDSDLDNTFNAYTINEIWKMAKEGGGIKNITQTGSGNAVTNMTLSSDGKTITAVFGETFARQQDLGTLNNTVTQLSNKLNNFLEGSDADNIINKWKELEAFLDGLTESDNLAELLALKADKTITISAGTGLTGGGNLSANRTLSLATTGVNAGTYTKVTVDTYGRVTVGDNPTTLAGYGITDAVTLTTNQTISGQKTFTKNILMNSGIGLSYGGNIAFRNTAGNTVISSYGNEGMIYFRPNGDTSDVGVIQINKQGHLNGVSAGFTGGVSAARLTANEYIQIGDAQLVYDSANKALRVKHRTDGNTVGFYSDGWVSALGVKTGGSGGGSGVVNTVYSFANLTDGTTFSDSDLDNTFNAYTIKKLYDMAGQGGLDADAMWAELKKADSSKVIDASHIPTSVLDGRWVTLSTNQTITGQKTFTQNILFSNNITGIRNTAGNLVFGAGNENIFCILNDYVGPVEAKNNKLVLGNNVGYWKRVTAGQYISKVATGLSPLIVSSNTTVDNLSADLLDGYHAFGTSNALIKYGYTVGGDKPAWCRIATYSIRNTETMTDVCFVLHSSFSDLFGLLVVKTRGTSYVQSQLMVAYNINTSNIRIYHDAEKKNIELYCYAGSNYSIIQANLLYSHDRNGGANTNITLYQADTKAPSWSTYVNPGFANLQNSSEAAKKLQTPRTLWGQSFDGTANVSGNMTGVGSINMSGQLTSTVASGTAPFIVASNTVVGNLNADLLDGFHAERFLLSVGRSDGTFDLNTYSERAIKEIRTTEQATNNAPFAGYGLLANLWDSNKFAALQIGGTSTDLFFRGKHDGTNKITSAWHRLLHTENYASIADGRYVKKAGDTMTGDLAMDTNKGFYIPHRTRVVKTSGNWIHGGGDTASSTDANLRFASWYGIGWYPTIDSTSGVRQGNNAMWLNVRTGVLDVHSNITSHNGYLAANWDSARRLVLGSGSSYAYIDSRNSSNDVLCDIVLQDNKVVIGNHAESSRFVSVVGTGTAPYQCSSTTLNTNLNADMLDNWHIMDIPRNYNSTATYSLQFALGGTDNGWKKIFACSESGAGPYRSVTVWGRIWYAYGNHAEDEVRSYHFCAIFQMRGGPSSSNNNVGNILNSARLYLPIFAKGMDNIRLVRVGTNKFELQVRQIDSHHNGHIQYQYWANGANASAWRGLQSTSNTSVAVSAGGAFTLADNRASSADVWTTTRTFYIQDYHSANTGAGVSVNGGSNCYLKLPSTTRFSRIDFSTPNANIRHSGNDNGNEVGSSTLSNLVIDSWYGVSFTTTCSSTYQNKIAMSVNCRTGRVTANNFHAATNITANGAITAKASSSDIRLKTDIQGYDAMGIIRKFRSVKYHWNAIAKENSEVFNHDNWNYGLIAQDLLSGGYTQWVKDIFNDYYTIDYERLIPVVWKGLQEVDDEVTRLKKRVRELEKRLGIN